MIPAMASPGQVSESLSVQFLVDSMLARVHTARPDGHLDYFNKRWLEYLGITLDDVPGWKWRAFAHREDVEGLWPSGEPASRPEKISNSKPASTGRMGNIAGCSTASVTPRQARQQLPRQNLVDRLRLTIGRTQLLIVNRPGLLKI
jgi:hypothetical protein